MDKIILCLLIFGKGFDSFISMDLGLNMALQEAISVTLNHKINFLLHFVLER